MKSALAQAPFQCVFGLLRRFDGADVELVSRAVNQAKVPEQKIATKEAVGGGMATRIKSLAMSGLVGKDRIAQFYSHQTCFRIRQRAEKRVVELNAQRTERFHLARDIAVYGCKRAACIDQKIAAFSVDLSYGKQMVAVIVFQRD
jgi:hypothetical protein